MLQSIASVIEAMPVEQEIPAVEVTAVPVLHLLNLMIFARPL